MGWRFAGRNPRAGARAGAPSPHPPMCWSARPPRCWPRRSTGGRAHRLRRAGLRFCASGAFTGDISAEMLRDAGATAVIVGHSERRHYHNEDDAAVAAKAAAAHRAGLTAIVCVGETENQRDAGKAVAVVAAQLAGSIPAKFPSANLTIAYEPVWAIGTGRTPTQAQIAEMHVSVRAGLAKRYGGEGANIRILYGGSVNPANAREILAIANVDGALVGGASLKAQDFLAIIRAARKR